MSPIVRADENRDYIFTENFSSCEQAKTELGDSGNYIIRPYGVKLLPGSSNWERDPDRVSAWSWYPEQRSVVQNQHTHHHL